MIYHYSFIVTDNRCQVVRCPLRGEAPHWNMHAQHPTASLVSKKSLPHHLPHLNIYKEAFRGRSSAKVACFRRTLHRFCHPSSSTFSFKETLYYALFFPIESHSLFTTTHGRLMLQLQMNHYIILNQLFAFDELDAVAFWDFGMWLLPRSRV